MLRTLVFAGTRREPPVAATRLGIVPPEDHVTVTLHLKRRSPDLCVPGSADDLNRLRAKRHSVETLATERRRTHRRAADRVTAFARDNGLAVDAVDLTLRTIQLSGSAAVMKTVFGAELALYGTDVTTFRARVGDLRILSAIAPWTRAVVGFDQRPLSVGLGTPAVAGEGLWPHVVAGLYGIPDNPPPAPCCIGIVALGGGYQANDLAAAMTASGLPMPTVIEASVGGAVNQFGQDDQADRELALDMQVVAGSLPQARIIVYFAPNDRQGLIDAVQQAITDTQNRPSVVSASWGSAEIFWTPASIDAMQAALADAVRLGVSVLFASGDGLATADVPDGKAHVWYPASSPYALGVGGTQATLDPAAGHILGEAVWNDGANGTGGGISDTFPVPVYQAPIALPKSLNDNGTRRGVPDVSALASTSPGYQLVVGGRHVTEGGTSAATPLWASLVARINAERSQPIGLVTPALYAHAAALRPVMQGDNRVGGIGYAAGPGWSACTGLGVPDGAALIAALSVDETV